MNKVTIGLIGYGTVGQGVVQLVQKRRKLFKDKFAVQFVIKTICDLALPPKDAKKLSKIKLTRNANDILSDPDIDIVVELIGGTHPAKEFIVEALKNGKHVVTANKAVISTHGKELFRLAQKNNRHLYFESAVGAGVPIIKSLTEGIAGNKYKGLYGIINGTCNFILSEMTKNNYSFQKALKSAQKMGYAESNPTLDINGMDSAHKLAIMIYLAFGKFLKIKDIYTEGITQISHDDIEYAESLGLRIKLLAIAKKSDDGIEARVHPTLISKDHPLASINSIYNAVYFQADPLGNILLSGEGAGQLAAASGVVSDLLNLAVQQSTSPALCNLFGENSNLKIRKIDDIKTKFYIRFMALDKPGVLSRIAGILGQHGISINSVTQKAHNPAATAPVIMLTDFSTERKLRQALNKIHKLAVVKSKPVAIRMERLQ